MVQVHSSSVAEVEEQGRREPLESLAPFMGALSLINIDGMSNSDEDTMKTR
jgi:hypothetical protein